MRRRRHRVQARPRARRQRAFGRTRQSPRGTSSLRNGFAWDHAAMCVRDAARKEGKRPRTDAPFVGAALKDMLTVQDLEDLVLAFMHVQRRVEKRGQLLPDREILGGCLDDDGARTEYQTLAIACRKDVAIPGWSHRGTLTALPLSSASVTAATRPQRAPAASPRARPRPHGSDGVGATPLDCAEHARALTVAVHEPGAVGESDGLHAVAEPEIGEDVGD